MTDQFEMRADVKAFLDQMKLQPCPAFTADVLAMIRTLPSEMMAAADMPVGEIAIDREFEVSGPAGPIALRLFDAREEREAGPFVVFFHGGGFLRRQHRDSCRSGG